MIVKVCGMRDPENIRDLLAMAKPDLMGLIFYPRSSRYVMNGTADPEFYRELDVTKVGVFVQEPLDQLLDKVARYGLGYAQLHGDEDSAYVAALRASSPVKIIKVFRIASDWDWAEVDPFLHESDWFLFDTATPQFGGSGKTFSWDLLRRYPYQVPFLLSGGIGEAHAVEIRQLMKEVPSMLGVDINSKFELAPARKDVSKIQTFIQELRLS
ncbi:Phosphoribosylanthranilate isomerase [Lunatimonas lonarensis]|uniref:N-(5'-phosphoribosyl)anthranilate isomerase n=1 Tax=Lunatimonas lonarensis TaxID=1232681 RepID=R7ZVL9_9BACT|nr:phosphoribosylanthranilate isomerase [Lunatimonas lonarensis]EON78185.1 Phosphoribosylanthranilate isomerase [Lunatimonas lonarensis]